MALRAETRLWLLEKAMLLSKSGRSAWAPPPVCTGLASGVRTLRPCVTRSSGHWNGPPDRIKGRGLFALEVQGISASW